MHISTYHYHKLTIISRSLVCLCQAAACSACMICMRYFCIAELSNLLEIRLDCILLHACHFSSIHASTGWIDQASLRTYIGTCACRPHYPRVMLDDAQVTRAISRSAITACMCKHMYMSVSPTKPVPAIATTYSLT